MSCSRFGKSVLLAVVFLASVAQAAENRFYFLDQRLHEESWKNAGFFLGLENSAPEGKPCDLSTLKLVLGVGDKSKWHYLFAANAEWTFEKIHHVRVVLKPESAELWLDGKCVERKAVRFYPLETSLLLNTVPPGYAGLSTYLVDPRKIQMARSQDGREVDVLAFTPQPPSRTLADIYQDPLRGVSRSLEKYYIKGGMTTTINVEFRLLPCDGIYKVAPLIDRYGQWAHSDWPGKVHSDEDIRKAAAFEEQQYKTWGTPDCFDRYGGYTKAGWKEKPTGHWRVTQRNGKYWLISPEGNPGFYIGLCGVGESWSEKWYPVSTTSREFLFEWLPEWGSGPFQDAWLPPAYLEGPDGRVVASQRMVFIAANMIRKYGSRDWLKKAIRNTARRVRTWGFSGGGKWGGLNREEESALGWFPVLHLPPEVKIQGRLLDVFNPKARAAARASLAEQVKPYKDNPWIVGLSIGNEDDGLVDDGHITGVLAMPADAPAKRALVDYATKEIYGGNSGKLAEAWKAQNADGPGGIYGASLEPPLEDIRKLRGYYADQMHGFLYQTTKELAPCKLYFGYWIPGWRAMWGHTDQWFIVARHCDVLGYDHYEPIFARPELARLIEEAKVPVLCGEFGFCTHYNFTRGFNIFGWAAEIRDDATAGRRYTEWIEAAAKHPRCVGVLFFEYHDQPAPGRDATYGFTPGQPLIKGENHAWGLVDVTDTPKWNLVRRVRRANLRANQIRLTDR